MADLKALSNQIELDVALGNLSAAQTFTKMRDLLNLALSHAAGQEVVGARSRGVPEGEPSRLLCWAFDNLNDMPISEEWAAEWCKQAEPLVLSGHPAIAAQRKEGE